MPLGGSATDVDLYIKPDRFSDVFLSNRVEAGRAKVLAASQRPATALAGSEPSRAAAWKTIPSWYMVATDDRAIGTDNLRFMAKRARPTTVEVDAPHDVLETNPDDVTDLILQAAQNARPSLARTGTTTQASVLSGVAVLTVVGGFTITVRARRSLR